MDIKLKILIVDSSEQDFHDAQKAIRIVIPESSFNHIKSIKALPAILSIFKPEIVIIDCSIAGFHFQEILNNSSELVNKIPVIIHTKIINEEIAIKCLEEGANDYQPKENNRRLGYSILQLKKLKKVIEETANDRKKLHELTIQLEKFKRREANIPGMVYQFVLHSDGTSSFVYASEASKKFLGIDSRELVLNNDIFSLLINPEDVREIKRKLTISAQTLEPFKCEARFLLNEKLRWYSLISRPHMFPNNDIIWDGILFDITEQKNIEEELAIEQNLMSTLLDNLPDVIYFKDLDSRFIKINNAYLTKLELGEEKEILGKSDFDMFSFEHANEARNDELEIIRSGEPIIDKVEKETWSSGKITWVSSTKLPFRDSNGNITGTFGISHDITKQKIAQEALLASQTKLTEALKIAHLAYWEYDVMQGQFIFNDQFYSLLHTSIAKEGTYTLIPEQYAKRFYPLEDLPLLKNKIRDFIETTNPNYNSQFEHEILYADGGIGYVSTRIFIEKDADNKTVKAFGAMQDITHRILKEHEKQALEIMLKQRNQELEETLSNLQQMQGSLVQSEKMASIGQLTAGIAHEINNPLAFVSSNMNRLKEYFQDITGLVNLWKEFSTTISDRIELKQNLLQIETYSKDNDIDYAINDFSGMIQSVNDGIKRIKKIVEGLRGFAHMADGGYSNAQINESIDETLTIVWNELKYKAEIIKEYKALPLINCNLGEIKQVLVNLLVNAAHSIEEKGIITIRTFVEGEYVFIKIEDTGCGIPNESLKRIFDPFYTTKPVGKGTGLGLWISSSIIEKHKGLLSVESKIGVGSIFTIKLPIKQ